MPDRRRGFWRSLPVGIKTVCVLLTFGIAHILHVELEAQHRCVELPNGLRIGRAAVFGPGSAPYRNIALKDANGRVFVDRDRAIDFYDYEAVAGTAPDTPSGKSDRYIYIKGIGMILRSKEPEKFQMH